MRSTIGVLVHLAAALQLAGSIACRTVPQRSDTTPPTVEIVYRFPAQDSEYKPAVDTQKWGEGFKLDLICRYKDSGGLQKITGDVNVAVKTCSKAGVCQVGCSCPLDDPTAPYSHAFQPDADGTVPAYTVFATTVTAGSPPFCKNDLTREVIGLVYTVQCSATNSAGLQAQKSAKFNMGNIGVCP